MERSYAHDVAMSSVYPLFQVLNHLSGFHDDRTI